MSTSTTARRLESVAIVVGPACAVAAGGILSNVRDDVGTTNVALVLATIVVLAAIAGRASGVVTALIAAASFNFFHTVPYHSLRVRDGTDVVTLALLVVIGLIIGEVAERRRRIGSDARRRLHGEQVLGKVVEDLAGGIAPDALWAEIHDVLVHDLRLRDCRFESRPTTDVPVVGRTGSLPGNALRLGEHGFALPSGGAGIEVAASGRTFGQIVLVPGDDSASLREERRVAVALADLYAVALSHAATPPRPGDITT